MGRLYVSLLPDATTATSPTCYSLHFLPFYKPTLYFVVTLQGLDNSDIKDKVKVESLFDAEVDIGRHIT